MPILHKIRRVKTITIILLVKLVIGGSLLLITVFKLDRDCGMLEGGAFTVLSVTGGMMINIINSALFVLYFAFASELFNIRIRGAAVGIPTLIGKAVASFAPQIADLARYYGVSILGMSVIPVCLALPLVIGMRETLKI